MVDNNEFVGIPGYEGKYQINRNGDVKSLARYDDNNHPVKERILKQSICRGTGLSAVKLNI